MTRTSHTKTISLNIRWLTGRLEQIQVTLPPKAADKIRYPRETVDKVKTLTMQYGNDKQTAAILNEKGIISATGKPFTRDMIHWIRFRYKIKRPILKAVDEFTVDQVCTMFNISRHMVYYWIKNKYVTSRKTPANIFLIIIITPEDKVLLTERINHSCKAKYMINAVWIIN